VYNYERTHTGKYCYGKTPVQTFPDSLCLAKEKMSDQQYEKTNKEDRLSAASNQKASGETTARPDDLSSVHFSLADIEEDDNRC